MIPLIYPPDSVTVHFATTSATGLDYVLVDNPDNEVYTILGISSLNRTTAGFNNYVRCGANNIYSVNRGATTHFELVTHKCSDDIIFQLGSGTPVAGYETSLDLVYVPYDINNSSMATDTPYTAYSSFQNGVQYSYNPFVAQMGIIVFVCVFFLFVVGLVKIFRKW